MRFGSPIPAQQLGSVAGRYQDFIGSSAARERLASRSGGRPRFPPEVPERRGSWASSGRVRGVVGSSTDRQVSQDRDERMARLEAVLFVAKVPLHPRKLGQYANLADGTEARTLIHRLNRTYDSAGRAFRVVEVAGGWQLRTRRQFANWLRRLPHVPKQIRLSAPAMETLAVIAYRQPVVRADVESVRGVACGEIIRQLMERDLVRVAGRSEELGRPFIYGTTKQFLEVFGLRDLEELPRAEWIKQQIEQRDTADDVADGNETGGSAVTLTATQHQQDAHDPLTTDSPPPNQAAGLPEHSPRAMPRGEEMLDEDLIESLDVESLDVDPDDVDPDGGEWEDGDNGEWEDVEDDDEDDDDYEYEEVDDDDDDEDDDEWEEVEVDDDDDEWEEVEEGDDLDDDDYEYEEVEINDDDDDDDDEYEYEEVDDDDDELVGEHEEDDEYEYEEVDVDDDDDEEEDDEDDEWEEVEVDEDDEVY